MMSFGFRWLLVVCMGCLVVGPGSLAAAERPSFLSAGKRIVFLGDSITAAGDYIAIVELELRRTLGKDIPELINLGLPSETCSGLSEPAHPFPRPNVHERLERVLEKAKPDVVVACYGMNDGIYYPFDHSRFGQYQEGIRQLMQQVADAGATLVLMSPPAFDPQPFREKGKLLPKTAGEFAWFEIYEHYDAVIQVYADWVLTLVDEVPLCVNLHDPVRDHLRAKRVGNPGYQLSGDGVHIDRGGHALLAKALLDAWGISVQPDTWDNEQVDSIHERQKLLHAAWLSHVGHKRPGMKPGLPLAEAQAKVAELERRDSDRLP